MFARIRLLAIITAVAFTASLVVAGAISLADTVQNGEHSNSFHNQ